MSIDGFCYIVDGTGEEDAYKYWLDMDRGFCAALSKKLGPNNAKYWRGPSLLGGETFDIANEVLDLIKSKPAHKIYLVGHSRGGAALIYVARRLEKMRKMVQAMFLFDAVDKTFTIGSLEYVPNNVVHCYHAMRDKEISSYYENAASIMVNRCFESLSSPNLEACSKIPHYYLENEKAQTVSRNKNYFSFSDKYSTLQTVIDNVRGFDIKNSMKSFVSLAFPLSSVDFENCGTKAQAPCVLCEDEQCPDDRCYVFCNWFLGSHGAMGGAPMATSSDNKIREAAPQLFANSDRAAVSSVNQWMSQQLVKEKLLPAGTTILDPPTISFDWWNNMMRDINRPKKNRSE